MTEGTKTERPEVGLYDPSFEKDGCGIGLIARPDGRATREVVDNALEILSRLAHRGAVGADSKTSDGAGFLSAIPRDYFRALPELTAALGKHDFAVGMIFSMPAAGPDVVRTETESLCAEHDFELLATRTVPVVSAELGAQAKALEPIVTQIFLKHVGAADRDLALLKSRRRLDNERSKNKLYVCSLSFDSIIYKGMLAPKDLAAYYVDLSSPNYVSPFAIVHSRFSTNTLPAWELAHPFRAISHNGEINTLKGNLAWMRSREAAFGELKPLIPTGISDSASLDHAVELLKARGASVAEALMILIPQAWESDVNISAELRDFYRYYSSRMEPWDGPAAVCFADKHEVGATLDRSGFRPCRYWILDDETLVVSSEVGAIDLAPERIVKRGRLGPGQMIAVNFIDAKILFNDDIKSRVASRAAYGEWLKLEERTLTSAPSKNSPLEHALLSQMLARFGVTVEEMQMVLAPMFASGEEPTSSMGNDTPLAILSERPQLLYKYFRQLFAQVTNPPIDPIREALVMSLATLIGSRPDPFTRAPSGTRIRIAQPILSSSELDEIKRTLHSKTLDLSFSDLEAAVIKLSADAISFAKSGGNVIVLSDRDGIEAPIPALLATASVHHALIRAGLRNAVSIIVDSGEPRDVHHFACLFGFGADAIHPYLALELAELHAASEGPKKFIVAIGKGLLTVMSKMGISCLRSYCGAQVFEAIGISNEVIDLCFAGTPSRVGGLSFEDIAREAKERVREAYALHAEQPLAFGLPSTGEIHYRKQGERHVWNPTTISKLQIAARQNDPATYAEFVAASEAASEGSLRAYLKLKPATPIALDEVEPASTIVKRFTTGAMSFGSLGQEAHETLAIAMNRMGAKSNSGEGGESTDRFIVQENGDRKISAIKQVASARFGVTSHYLVNAVELQIKVAQGAKPGEGGKLPGYKVDAVIAKLRHSTAGVTLISPPPHHDIYSIEDLAQLIFDLRRANSEARISVKLVAAAGIGTIAAGVVKAGADKILISGDGGGTGASPLSSIKSAGSPWELGLSEVQQTLVMQGLRAGVVLEADGQMRTARDVAIAAALGAEEFGFSTAPLVVEGCIMMRKCHLNTCPVGVATQDPELRKKFTGAPEHVVNYFFFVASELRVLLASLGLRSVDELVGRTEHLEQAAVSDDHKSARLDLKRLLVKTRSAIPDVETQRRFLQKPARPANKFDQALIEASRDSILLGRTLVLKRTLENENRAVGTSLASLISRAHGEKGLPADTITIDCTGIGGQSFGAFLAKGLTLKLDGEANDYVGKGFSGGKIVIAPHWAKLRPSNNEIVAGNACFYGATSGEAFIAGSAGERFAVRNSGARIVIEGTGDHGCEYMTGGTVVILGRTGRNFGAGMSGGQVFVFDDAKKLDRRLGSNDLEFRRLETQTEERELKLMIESHARETESAYARWILGDWQKTRLHFVVLTPLEYKKALSNALPNSAASKELAHAP